MKAICIFKLLIFSVSAIMFSFDVSSEMHRSHIGRTNVPYFTSRPDSYDLASRTNHKEKKAAARGAKVKNLALEEATKLQLSRPKAQEISNELFFRAVNNVGCADFGEYFNQDLLPRLAAMRERGLNDSTMKNLVWDYSHRRFRSFNNHYGLTTESLIALFSNYLATGSVDADLLQNVSNLSSKISCNERRPASNNAPSHENSPGADTEVPTQPTLPDHGNEIPSPPTYDAPYTPPQVDPSIPTEKVSDSGSWLARGANAGTKSSRGHDEPVLLWNECEGRIKGNYSNDYSTASSFAKKFRDHTNWKNSSDVKIKQGSCAKNRVVSREFFDFMEKSLPQCLAKALGVSEDKIVFANLAHVGVTADSKHSPKSLHTVARAIDITGFEIYLAGENQPRRFNHAMASHAIKKTKKNLSPAQLEQTAFWRNFRNCTDGLGGGSLGPEFNSAHEGHVHISLTNRTLRNKGFYSK